MELILCEYRISPSVIANWKRNSARSAAAFCKNSFHFPRAGFNEGCTDLLWCS